MRKILIILIIIGFILISGCTSSAKTYVIPYEKRTIYTDGINTKITTENKELTAELYPDGKACIYEGTGLFKSDPKCGTYRVEGDYVFFTISDFPNKPGLIQGGKILFESGISSQSVVYSKNLVK